MSTGTSPTSKAVALIAGPTASGKSDLAGELALEIERRGGRAVILNADSAQVYADLQVLSARPSPEEMRGIEHRLFGAWDGAQACSAADWAHAAKREIENAQLAGAVPILVGGTGLYIRTLLDGIAPVPPIDPAVREAVRAMPAPEMWAALVREDPRLAPLLHPGDRARVARGLEVVRSTGTSLLAWRKRKEGGIGAAVDLHPLILLPDRATLYARCDARFDRMVEAGARGEVERLLARNLSPASPVMRAIGVPEIGGWIAGMWNRAEAISRGQQATRNYAKRQYTWFRNQPPTDWRTDETANVSIAAHFEILFRSLWLT
jgi:tRNA dimethylallyltransferase